MKHIKLLKSLIIVAPVLALVSPLIILSNTGCGNPNLGGAYLADGSNWVGRTGGTLSYTVNDSDNTYTIKSSKNFTTDSTFTIPHFVALNNKKYSVTTIGSYAFQECTGLTGVDLGGVTTIGVDAFDGCPLEKISVDPGNETYKFVGTDSHNGFIQKKDDDATLTAACGDSGGIACGNIVIPGGVTTISDNAFCGCAGLTRLALNSVTTIGDNAFLRCQFEEISVDPGNETYKFVGTDSHNGFIQKKDDDATLTAVCGSWGGLACGNIVIPGSFTTIDNYAFYECVELTGVDFGSVTTIDANAFCGCTGLTKINLGNVTSISDEAFSKCPLGEISVDPGNETYKFVGTDSHNGFIQKKDDDATLTAVCGRSGGIACGNITFSGNVTAIGSYAFNDCLGLTGVDFGSVTLIAGASFWGCKGLTSVNLSGVTTLRLDWCFDCLNLSSVTIGSQTYTSYDDGWDNVGPATGCILRAPNVPAADAFKTYVILNPNAAKWTFQRIQ